MSRLKTGRKRDALLTFRCTQSTVDAIDKFHKEAGMSKTDIVEAALFHLLNLPKSQQKEIIAKYLTKNL